MFLAPISSDVQELEETEKHVPSGTLSYPYSLDWREKGLVSPVNRSFLYVTVHENQPLCRQTKNSMIDITKL